MRKWDPQQPLERQSGEFAAHQQQLQARLDEFECAREEGEEHGNAWILPEQAFPRGSS